MKFQAASVLIATAFVVSVKAAWEAPSGGNSWDTLCGAGTTSKYGPSHVCFTSSLDETTYDGASSKFRGCHQGGHDFVIFQGKSDPAVFQNDHWMITIHFGLDIKDQTGCASYEVYSFSAGVNFGRDFYCPGQPPVKLA